MASFGSGSRYADWAGVVFKEDTDQKPKFAFADLRLPGVEIEQTWQAMSLSFGNRSHSLYECHCPVKIGSSHALQISRAL